MSPFVIAYTYALLRQTVELCLLHIRPAPIHIRPAPIHTHPHAKYPDVVKTFGTQTRGLQRNWGGMVLSSESRVRSAPIRLTSPPICPIRAIFGPPLAGAPWPAPTRAPATRAPSHAIEARPHVRRPHPCTHSRAIESCNRGPPPPPHRRAIIHPSQRTVGCGVKHAEPKMFAPRPPELHFLQKRW